MGRGERGFIVRGFIVGILGGFVSGLGWCRRVLSYRDFIVYVFYLDSSRGRCGYRSYSCRVGC